MKKVLSILATIFLVGGIFWSPATVSALSILDQEQAEGGGGNYIDSHQYTGQSFKPTKNVLNAISIKLKGANNTDQISMEVTKTNDPTKTLLLPPTLKVTTTTDANFRWYDFTFPDTTVTVGQSYTIWLAAFSGSNAYWEIDSGGIDHYIRGKAYIDCPTFVSTDACDHPTATADWTFRTYGYSTLTPPIFIPPATPPTDSPFTPEAASTNTTKVAATPEAALGVPVLTTLKKGETDVTVPVKETVEVTQNGKLSLTGTSVAGGEVDVTFGDRSYPATMESSGNWKLDISFTDIKVAEYTIKAKTLKENKTSSEVEFFKVKVSAVDKAETVAKDKSWFAGWNIFYTLIAVGVLLLVLLLLAVMARRHHHEKTAGNDNEKKEDAPVEEKPEEETAEEPKKVTKKKK